METNLYFIGLVLLLKIGIETNAQIPEDYKGKPFKPYSCAAEAQVIPGRIELAYYDKGGEGIAYHDNDALNNGAELSHKSRHNPPGVSEEIAFFREKEGVDVSFTKSWVDFTESNMVIPGINQQYIGWQEDGEWTNYTVDVKVAGIYRIIALYSNKDNNTSLWLNGKFATKLFLPENTRYWHYWNKAELGEIEFPFKGLNLLTLKYNKGANLAYLDFVLIE
jgi:hypothetical protein